VSQNKQSTLGNAGFIFGTIEIIFLGQRKNGMNLSISVNPVAIGFCIILCDGRGRWIMSTYFRSGARQLSLEGWEDIFHIGGMFFPNIFRHLRDE
jgi:hypothetical protein